MLLLEQASRTVPLLANRALFGLLLTSFGVLLVAGGILLLFATRLSLRLGRLRNAAERAQLNDGRLDGLFESGQFPMTDAPDELGDLARSFEQAVRRGRRYTDYLRTLASKLSHELNTPLAIVKSSLDNLDHPQAPLPAEAQPYLARARDGVERLGTLVRAMSESSRIERSIAAAEAEDFDLRDVVRGCAEAYRPLIGTRELDCELPASAAAVCTGAPELIAQALDKLLDNALSFTPADGWMRAEPCAQPTTAPRSSSPIRARRCPQRCRIGCSIRWSACATRPRRGEAPHLGLGLYVVRLVAELHRGCASARNLDDGGGVEFALRLHGMPRVDCPKDRQCVAMVASRDCRELQWRCRQTTASNPNSMFASPERRLRAAACRLHEIGRSMARACSPPSLLSACVDPSYAAIGRVRGGSTRSTHDC